MNAMEKRYYDLTFKAIHAPLTDAEQNEMESIQKELNIQPCGQCEGQGSINLPSMAGGYEHCNCRNCKGLGEIVPSEALKKELEELYN